MRNKTVAVVAANLTITTFELPDIDLDIYVQHVKSMKQPSCVFVDNIVVYPGLFDSESIAKAKKKLQLLMKKETL